MSRCNRYTVRMPRGEMVEIAPIECPRGGIKYRILEYETHLDKHIKMKKKMKAGVIRPALW